MSLGLTSKLVTRRSSSSCNPPREELMTKPDSFVRQKYPWPTKGK